MIDNTTTLNSPLSRPCTRFHSSRSLAVSPFSFSSSSFAFRAACSASNLAFQVLNVVAVTGVPRVRASSSYRNGFRTKLRYTCVGATDLNGTALRFHLFTLPFFCPFDYQFQKLLSKMGNHCEGHCHSQVFFALSQISVLGHA
jgi:hypothetical protein